jgi:hypothetical protein
VPADNEWEWGVVCLGRARFDQGRTAEAIKILSSVKEWGYLAYVYAKSGRPAEAEKLMAEAPILHPDHRGAHQFAVVFAGRSGGYSHFGVSCYAAWFPSSLKESPAEASGGRLS